MIEVLMKNEIDINGEEKYYTESFQYNRVSFNR